MFIHHCSIIPDGPSHVQQVLLGMGPALKPERQLMQTYMMDNHEGKDIEYRGLISFSAEDADSVADAFRDFASMVEGLIREERQRR